MSRVHFSATTDQNSLTRGKRVSERMSARVAQGAVRTRLFRLTLAFLRQESGQIAVMFGLTVMALLLGAGAGTDLMRAYQTRQKLSEVATLTCQYSSRPSVVQMANSAYVAPSGGQTYSSAVTAYLSSVLTSQKVGWTQTNATPFTYTSGGPANVSLSANVPTTLMRVVGFTTIPVAATSHCYDSPDAIPPATPSGNLLEEGFEATDGQGYTFYQIAGHPYTSPTNTFVPQATYTGAGGTAWYATGYCLETDAAGIISASVPEGSRSAELDCDNGSGSAGNSAISTKAYLPVGNYELRFFYRSRVDYPNYVPDYLCGSSASDLTWANDTNSSGGPVANALRTNQMNVYLDLDSSGAPPMHTTMLGGQQLAGSNLVDMCVYSKTWVERSVRVFANSPGFYWLTFAADGLSDSYGAQVDYIRLCPQTCTGTLQDNYPSTWLAANNGGVNKVLFRDTFDSPTYAATSGCTQCATNGNMNNSVGTSGTASSGWPNLAASGWATGPYNNMFYYVLNNDSIQGAQHIQLDGNDSGSLAAHNGLISRRFLLTPGYYNVTYNYKASSSVSGIGNPSCGATPAAAGITSVTTAKSTNFLASFMSHAQLASTPIGGGALNSTTSYTNPDGTTTTTPTVAPNGISFSAYDPTQPNPVLDICGYASSWQTRSANIQITKIAYYWLTLSALGRADDVGGKIDDVRVTALGSLYMASPPASPVTIPVPNPQPSARVNYTGFYIVSNPMTSPAPLQ
jgi:hypothetical protein